MMGIISDNTGVFGDVVKASQFFGRNELPLIQEQKKLINSSD